MSYGADVLGVTEETFSMIKAQTTGWLSATGVTGVDLLSLISLVPVVTPFRNSIARVKPPQGANQAYWRALLNINSQQPNPAVGNDYGAAISPISEQDVSAPFVPLRTSGRVTEDAIDLASGYADALALETIYVYNQLLIGEDIHGINGQAYALPTIGTPTGATATTGGTIAASTTVYFKVAARSGVNYYYGGSGVASTGGSQASASSTATNTVTATVTGVEGAAAYDWYVGASSGTLYYYSTTYVPSVTITAIPTANQALPSTSAMPLLYSTAPTAVPTADTSYSSNYYNGLTASILGDYSSSGTNSGATLVTPGSGTNSGQYWASNAGAALTAVDNGIAAIDTLNAAIWNTALISPTRYLVSARVGQQISNLLFNSAAALIYLQPADDTDRMSAVAGGVIARYINRSVPGKVIKIEVHPHVPPGQLIAVTDVVDYPGSNIGNPLSFRVQRDFSTFQYGANLTSGTLGGGPRHDFGISVRETFVNQAAATMAVLQDIG